HFRTPAGAGRFVRYAIFCPPRTGWPGRYREEDGSVESLAELRERRAFECRLSPGRALRSLDDAEACLGGRGLLTRTPASALPSLYEASHEDPYHAPGRG